MSNVVNVPKSNIALFENYGFKIPSDPKKNILLESLLEAVQANPPAKVSFSSLVREQNSVNNYNFEASMTYNADTNQLILGLKGSVSLEDQTDIVAINEIIDTSLSIYELGTLASPIELFSDCIYSVDDIRKAALLVFKTHEEVFKSNLLRKALLDM